MCDKPFLLEILYTDDRREYYYFPGEGQAEEAGIAALNEAPETVSFRIFGLFGEFKRVTKIERVSIKPELKPSEVG